MATSTATIPVFTAPYAVPIPIPTQIHGNPDHHPSPYASSAPAYAHPPAFFPAAEYGPANFPAPYHHPYPAPPPGFYPSPPPAYPPPLSFPCAYYPYPHLQPPPGFFPPPPFGYPHSPVVPSPITTHIDTNGEPNWPSPAADQSPPIIVGAPPTIPSLGYPPPASAPKSAGCDSTTTTSPFTPQCLTSGHYLDRLPASSTTNRDDAVSLAQQPLDSVPEVFVKRPTPSPAFETATIASVSGAVQAPDADLPTAVQFLATGQFIYCGKPSHKHRGLDIISMPNTGQDHSSSSTTSDLLIDRLPSSSTNNKDGGATVRVDCVLQAVKTGIGKIQELVSVSAPQEATRAFSVPSVTNSVAPNVVEEIPTPSSGQGKQSTTPICCYGHRIPIQSLCGSNLSEQNIDERPPVFDVYNDETEDYPSMFFVEPGSDTHGGGKASKDQTYLPVFDVYDDAKKDCSNSCVDVSARTSKPLFSNEFVDVFASTPNQQLHKEKQPETEHSNACLNISSDVRDFTLEVQHQNDEKASIHVSQLRAPRLNTVRQSISDQSGNTSSLNTPWDPGVPAIHPRIKHSSTRTTSKTEWVNLTSSVSCICSGQAHGCVMKPIFSLAKHTVGIDIEQLLNGLSKAPQGRTWEEESPGEEKLLLKKSICRTATDAGNSARLLVLVVVLGVGMSFIFKTGVMRSYTSGLDWQKVNASGLIIWQLPVINKKSVWDPGITIWQVLQDGYKTAILCFQVQNRCVQIILVCPYSKPVQQPFCCTHMFSSREAILSSIGLSTANAEHKILVWNSWEITKEGRDTSALCHDCTCQLTMTKSAHIWWYVKLMGCSVSHTCYLAGALWPLTQLAITSSKTMQTAELTSRYLDAHLHLLTCWTRTTSSDCCHLHIYQLDVIFVTFLPP